MRLCPKRLNQAGDPAGAFLAGRADFHIREDFHIRGDFLCTGERSGRGASVLRELPRSRGGTPVEPLSYGGARPGFTRISFLRVPSHCQALSWAWGTGEVDAWKRLPRNLTFE